MEDLEIQREGQVDLAVPDDSSCHEIEGLCNLFSIGS